jgi:hypothetical protein
MPDKIQYQSLKVYRIQNRITKEEQTIAAESAQEACEKLGWKIGHCWVRILLDPSDDRQISDGEFLQRVRHDLW